MPRRSGAAQNNAGESRVIVGVDGSECGTRALEFAAHEAALRGARLEVVSAYGATPYVTAWPPVLLESDHQKTALAIVEESLAHANHIDPALVTKGETRYGDAGGVLSTSATVPRCWSSDPVAGDGPLASCWVPRPNTASTTRFRRSQSFADVSAAFACRQGNRRP